MGIVAYVQTHKTWTALWAGFAIFWLIGFGYYCSKLDNVVFDAHPYYMDFRATREMPLGRKWPAWLACPGIPMGENPAIEMTCKLCGPPPKGENPPRPSCHEIPAESAGDDHHLQNCFVFNNAKPVYERSFDEEVTAINCNVNFTNTSKARVYVFDQQWPIDFEEGHPILPNGAVMHTLPKDTRSLLEITREVYEKNDGKSENSYSLLDGETYANTRTTDSSSSFMLYWGTFVDKVFTQSQKKITTHYDFWYWIGFIGGISFFCYSLHSIIYSIISIALGWKEEEEGFASLA